ncbi:MAG: NAD/NADP octopine/nopaline dehydrogenase family protein [Sedimentibacter sp.]|uniref:NAD/NADP-dependent octopine/nopaline dehydrogenase family protein n=1 Tax=Sedimentibacter sp. TaxID=1960295 RepID=UPI003158EAB7
MKKLKFAVLGAGNGGQSISAYLTLKGYDVKLYDKYDEVVAPLIEKGNIELRGVSLNGNAVISVITTDISKAVEDTDIILVTVPSNAHSFIANELAPVLKDGQVIVLCPGSTGGALEFKKILNYKNCSADYKLAETTSLFYACRAKEGVANISGVKNILPIASLPSSDVDYIINLLDDVYPQLVKEENVIASSLNNLNAILHPIAVLLSTSWIEATGGNFKFYYDSITPSVGKLIERMDAERMSIGKALNVHVKSAADSLKTYYSATGDSIYDMVRTVKAYEPISAPPSLNSRLLFEDIPMGLVPMVELAKLVSVNVPTMNLIIDLASQVLEKDFREEGRSLERLGISNMNIDELNKYVSNNFECTQGGK